MFRIGFVDKVARLQLQAYRLVYGNDRSIVLLEVTIMALVGWEYMSAYR